MIASTTFCSANLDDYESYNPHVLEFVKKYSGLTGQQIRADTTGNYSRNRKYSPPVGTVTL